MANCRYSLTIYGKSIEFSSYAEMFQVLINNKHKIELGDLSDIVFSLNTQSEIEAKIKLIKNNAKSIKLEKVGIDKITEDILYKSNDKYISVSDLVKNPENHLNNPFNIEEYKTIEIAKLVESGMSNVDATAEIEARLQKFENVAEKAQQVKSVVALYLSGLTNAKALMDKVENSDNFGWDFSVYSNITNQLDSTIEKIKAIHGVDVKLIPNVNITSNLNGSEAKLVGTIDLVAVDSKGVPHIYTFKNSEKTSDEWQNVREQDVDYKLGFYRHMLAANGMNVKDSGLYVVPINLEISDGNLIGTFFEDIQDRLVPTRSGLNRLNWGGGSFYNAVSTFVPVTITNDLVVSDIRDKVMSYLSKGLGVKSLKNSRSVISLDNFIATKVHESNDPEKGKWMFTDFNHTGAESKQIYIKEDSPRESNMELREKAEKYLADFAKTRENAADNIIKNIKKAIRGDIDINAILPNSKNPDHIGLLLGKYVGDDWEIVDIPKLRDLGIIGFQNTKTRQTDFITLSYQDLNTPFKKLGLGTTILGMFESDRTAIVNNKILKATNGNVELMKVLFAINEIPELFNGIFKVGDIKVLNPAYSEATYASQQELWTSFNKLTQYLGITNHLATDVEFVDQFEIFSQDFLSTFKDNKRTGTINNIYSDLFKNPIEKRAKLDILYRTEEALKKAYSSLLNISDELILKKANNPIVQLYLTVWQSIHQLEGDPFYQSFTLQKYGATKGLSGTKTSTPSTIGDNNLRTMNTWVKNAMANITNSFLPWNGEFQQKYVINLLWKSKGYSQVQENIKGSQSHLYDNFFVTNKDGSINKNMLFKNPWTDNSLDKDEKAFLKRVLFEINKERYAKDLENVKDENSPLLQRLLENKEKAFWVPVVKATTAARWSQAGLTNILKQQLEDIKDAKSLFLRTEEGLDTANPEVIERVNKIRNKEKELFEFFDPIEISESNENSRLDYIAGQDFNYWSRNIEDIVSSYKFAKIQKREYDKVLPKIKALKIAAMLYGRDTGIDMENFIDYLDDQVKLAIHSQTILNPESQQAAGYVSYVKFLASAVTLGFNPRGVVRECIEGIWKYTGRSLIQTYGRDQFNKSDVAFAVKALTEETPDFITNVTIGESLNNMFRLADTDINKLAERVRTNKAGLLNVSERMMFWSNTAPDYRNRLTMLIAQLHHDGIWDALSVKDRHLVYDWKKDKRFSILASGNKSNPEYAKQLGLYLSLMNDINEHEGLNLKFGDALPRMYMQAEMQALKDFSDRVFGSYDHDVRMQVEKTFMGMMFMQFKTYLSATKDLWLMQPGGYNLGAMEQKIDEKTGKKVWLKEETNQYGETIWVPTLEETGIPDMINVQSYYEGIWYTLKDSVRALREGKWGMFKSEIWDDKVKKNNLKLLAYNVFVLTFILGMSKYLLDLLKDQWKEDHLGEVPTYSTAMLEGLGSFFEKAYLGSAGDMNILSTVYSTVSNSEPAALSVLTRFIDNTNQTVFGDMKVSTLLKNNIGIIRSTKDFWDNLSDVYHFGEIKVKELSE